MRIYLDIWGWKCKRFSIGIHHTLSDAIDIDLGFYCILIFYKPEE